MEKFKVDRKSRWGQYIGLVLTGAATGLLSGLLGGGGGMLVVPALSAIMKISEKQSHATAIAVILPVTVVSSVVYLLRGVTTGADFPMTAAGVVLGGLLGAMLLSKLSNKILSAVFYAVMIAAGIKMLL